MIELADLRMIQDGGWIVLWRVAGERARVTGISWRNQREIDRHRTSNWSLEVRVIRDPNAGVGGDPAVLFDQATELETNEVIEPGWLVFVRGTNQSKRPDRLHVYLHTQPPEAPIVETPATKPPPATSSPPITLHFDCPHCKDVEVTVTARTTTITPPVCYVCDRDLAFTRTGTQYAAHVMIATPVAGVHVGARYVESLVRALPMLERANVKLSLAIEKGTTSVVRGRNTLVARFLKSKASHLLFVDDDMAWLGEDLVRMLAAKQDFIGGACALKEIDWPQVYAFSRAGMGSNAVKLLASPIIAKLVTTDRGDVIRHAEHEELVKADGIGGFMLITRQTIDRMIAAYPALRYWDQRTDDWVYKLFAEEIVPGPIDGRPADWSEDLTFCKRWTDIGGEIWIDARARFEHIGDYAFIAPTIEEKLTLMDRVKSARAASVASTLPPPPAIAEAE